MSKQQEPTFSIPDFVNTPTFMQPIRALATLGNISVEILLARFSLEETERFILRKNHSKMRGQQKQRAQELLSELEVRVRQKLYSDGWHFRVEGSSEVWRKANGGECY